MRSKFRNERNKFHRDEPVLKSQDNSIAIPRLFSNLEESVKRRGNVPIALVLCCVCIVFIATPAYAYIDPNAAGLVSQILTPLFVAAAAGLTFFGRRLADVFATLSRRLRRCADVQ